MLYNVFNSNHEQITAVPASLIPSSAYVLSDNFLDQHDDVSGGLFPEWQQWLDAIGIRDQFAVLAYASGSERLSVFIEIYQRS